jgi:DNA-binding NarL/FixJ family response regulator
MSIKLLVADDHEVVRLGLSCLLRETDIDIVGEATDGEQAIEKALALDLDLVLLDVRLPLIDGLTALVEIREARPDIPVVMMSTYDNPTYVARSVALGAADYVLKGDSREDLVEAISNAAQGEPPADDSVWQRVHSSMAKRRERTDGTTLTNREFQVLRHVALGLSNREIGHSLQISIETVKEHVQNVLRKIDVTDRTQAAVWAVRQSLI